MEANRCGRKGSKVKKINIPLLWTSLRDSPFPQGVVSSCFVAPLLFPLLYFYVARMRGQYLAQLFSPQHCFQSAHVFDLLLPVVFGITEFHYTLCGAKMWNFSSFGAWERWPQGLTVGSKIVWSQGMSWKDRDGKQNDSYFLSSAACLQVGCLWERTISGCWMCGWPESLLAPQGVVSGANTWVIVSQSGLALLRYRIRHISDLSVKINKYETDT